MGNDGERERERLREIGVRAFRQVFDEPTVEQALEVLGEYRDRPGVAGFQWGHTVGYDVGVTLVLWNAIKWKFDRQVADAVSSLFADILDTGCVLDVMAVVVKVDRPYDLRDAALARLARSMDRPPEVPEPVLRLRKAFQAAQRAADEKGGTAAGPAEDILPGPYRQARRGWIRGMLAGYREGMHDTLRRIINERFGEWITLAASIVLDERIDRAKAGVLASVLLDVSDPLGVLYWTEEIASMDPNELRQLTSHGPPSGDDPVPWPWPPRRPPATDN